MPDCCSSGILKGVLVETPREQLFFITAYLEGRAGADVVVGTGFLYSVDLEGGTAAPFLVTNKHVFDGLDALTIRLVKRTADGQPSIGAATQVTIEGFNDQIWQGHPDPAVDVGVMPLQQVLEAMDNQGGPAFFRVLSPEVSLNPKATKDLDAIEDVLFVGYPAGIFDKSNFTPVVRRGITATPLALDYEGHPAFLVDASVFPGSSGSPVFIVNHGSYSPRSGGLVVGNRLLFLGVLAAVHTHQIEGDASSLPAGLVVTVDEALDLGIVYKARTVDECIDLVLQARGVERARTPASQDD